MAADEQKLFRRLAVFAGGWTLEAAMAVAGSPESGEFDLDLIDSLERLAEHSLLRQEGEVDGEPRFAMLETVREFGLEQLLAHGELAEARQRHADYFRTLAEKAELETFGPNQGAWMDRIETEHDNIRTALTWALEHDIIMAAYLVDGIRRFWLRRGYLSEGSEWFERVLASFPKNGATPLRVRLTHGWASFLLSQARDVQGKALIERALEIAREGAYQEGEVRALQDLGMLASYNQNLEESAALTTKALELSKMLKDRRGISTCLNNLGLVAFQQGDYERAITLIEEAVTLDRHAGDTVGLGENLHSLGDVYRAQENYGQAARCYREGLELTHSVRDWMMTAAILHGLAGLILVHGNPARAARLYGAAAELLATVGGSIAYSASYASYPQDMDRARTELGAVAFDAAFQRGRALSPAEAVATALDANVGDVVVPSN